MLFRSTRIPNTTGHPSPTLVATSFPPTVITPRQKLTPFPLPIQLPLYTSPQTPTSAPSNTRKTTPRLSPTTSPRLLSQLLNLTLRRCRSSRLRLVCLLTTTLLGRWDSSYPRHSSKRNSSIFIILMTTSTTCTSLRQQHTRTHHSLFTRLLFFSLFYPSV